MPSPRSICAAGTLRRATRSITRVYDKRLAAIGLTTTQFSILRSLAAADVPMALSELAEEQVFERTSLYRALTPLCRQRLILIKAGHGRAKLAALTPLGVKRVAAALPCWQEAQDAFVAQFGSSAWRVLASQLIGVIDAAKAVGAASKARRTALRSRLARFLCGGRCEGSNLLARHRVRCEDAQALIPTSRLTTSATELREVAVARARALIGSGCALATSPITRCPSPFFTHRALDARRR
jgi:DNA-binding MarR family transcriptional regulator